MKAIILKSLNPVDQGSGTGKLTMNAWNVDGLWWVHPTGQGCPEWSPGGEADLLRVVLKLSVEGYSVHIHLMCPAGTSGAHAWEDRKTRPT